MAKKESSAKRKREHGSNLRAGRPKIEIKEDVFDLLMEIPFVTMSAICAVLECSPDVIEKYIKQKFGCNFTELKEQKAGNMTLRLAAKQYEMAMKGNVPLLIWLGKQYLGQTEKQKITAERVEGSSSPVLVLPSNGRELQINSEAKEVKKVDDSD